MKVLNPLKVPSARGSSPASKVSATINGRMRLRSSLTTASVSWNHTRPSARPTGFRPEPSWKALNWIRNCGMASSSTTTPARWPRCPGPSSASCRRQTGRLGEAPPAGMIARVTLEIALRKEFDYLIPPELAGQVDVGSRVQVPFGPRKVLGCVTAVAEESAQATAQAHPQGHRRADAGHAQGAEAGALDRRILLLRAGDGAQERAARSGAPGGGGLARAAVCARAAGRRGTAEAAQAPAGSLEHHRGTARAAAAGIAGTGGDHRGHGPPPGGPGPGARSRRRSPSATPTRTSTSCRRQPLALEPGAGQARWRRSRRRWTRAQDAECGRRQPEADQPRSATSAPRSSTFPPARRHRQRQDRGLSAGHRPRAGAGQGRDRAGAGDFAHAADGRAVQGAVQLRAAADAGGRAAQPSFRRRAPRRMAQDPAGPRADRHRRALGDLRAGGTARADHRGRGARAHLQAGGSAALPRARRGGRARPDGRRGGGARLGHAVAGELLQLRSKGKYTLLELPERADDKKMPLVRVVDMRQAVRAGQRAFPSSRRSSRKPSRSGWSGRSRRFCS